MFIKGTMVGLNEYSGAERTNRHVAASIKLRETERVAWIAKKLPRFKSMVHLTIVYIEPNRKRDKDNIAFAKKFILDGMKDAGAIPNDGWAWIDGWSESFTVDKNNPGILITVKEVNTRKDTNETR